MNQKGNSNNLSSELNNSQPYIDDLVIDKKLKSKKSKGIINFFVITVSSCIVFLIAFVAMVNFSITFAMACSQIPLIRELAVAVAYSPSLSAAVANQYVQPMELEQVSNDIVMKVEYVIVDQKQLNIFYSLQSPIYSNLYATPYILNSDGTQLEGYSIQSGSYGMKNDELRKFTIDFTDRDMPESLMLICKVHDNGSNQISEPVSIDLMYGGENTSPKAISTFNFMLAFNSTYTPKGEIINLNQSFILDGQKLKTTTIEVYPTHIRLNLEAEESNTAWLKSLNFYLENEKGERFEAITNGITATGSLDSPMMTSFRLESSFFSKSNNLVLYITEATWLDKDKERVKIDLVSGTAGALPEGVTLESSIHKENGWELVFSAVEREENSFYQLFGSNYYDESGQEYEYNNWWSTGEEGYYDENNQQYIETLGLFRVSFLLENYPYDTVYLSPSFSRMVKLTDPLEIKVK